MAWYLDRSFFNWSRGAKEADTPPPPPQFQYHDLEPPFPMSLVGAQHAGRVLSWCYRATVDCFGLRRDGLPPTVRLQGPLSPCVVVGYTAGGSFGFGGFSPEGYRSTDARACYPGGRRYMRERENGVEGDVEPALGARSSFSLP